jgi:hypothetical protein
LLAELELKNKLSSYQGVAMPTTRAELDRFHQFAADQIGVGTSPWELEDLLIRWIDEQQHASIDAAIDRGIAEMEAGLGRPAQDVSEELRQKHGIPQP